MVTLSEDLNTAGPKVNGYLDLLIMEQAKLMEQMKKYEEKKKQRDVYNNCLNALANISNVTSGQLAINDCWVLGQHV
jgi:hypothetical protein